MSQPIFDIEIIRELYSNLVDKVDKARRIANSPLTLTEKILYSHIAHVLPAKLFSRGVRIRRF